MAVQEGSGLGGAACKGQKRNGELSSGSDPDNHLGQMLRKTCSGVCVRMGAHGAHTFLDICSLREATNPDLLPLLQVRMQRWQEDSKRWTKKTSRNMRGTNGRKQQKPAQGTFIILLWARKQPGAGTHGFKNWLSSNKVKEREKRTQTNKTTPVSLIPLVITKQQKQ